MGCRISQHRPEMSTHKGQYDDDERVEHISDRQDHLDHEIQVLHNVLPLSSEAPSPPSRKLSRSTSRRFSVAEDDLQPLELANSRKFNSTSTLFVDSTVSSPNLEETLRCVALALSYVVEDGHKQDNPRLFSEKFDEKRHPITDRVRRDYASRIPSENRIYKFMFQLFNSAQLTAECAIITLVYVNRLIAYTSLTLHASTWKRVVLGAILLASKVWDDQAVWNVDFCSMLPSVAVEDMNDLERTFLEMLDFNIDVDSCVYAKYYFELRALAEKFEKDFPLKPLNKDQAKRLEALSERRHDLMKGFGMRGAQSLDPDEFRAKAIIS
ncbi:CCNYL1 protein [Salpingoeca rosetta]|uniref:CCNYL1 protein n=1 Tax=Salpingoeca rosetta (strain ATCC 50818 / BSB-021) TaxID=946362 RepID=F2U5C0_SALR5|nr:CCNYL1 protein [Salpingoeca rosetta]EGD83136.1 CCNYL1 protein [Salpingoeca rosetta]|eukprot:XP_004995500.1 CCNYL1 protein [Salpingoeca rosetta]